MDLGLRWSGWPIALAAAFAVLALVPSAAPAATLTVTTTADELNAGDGLCSLREAITAVNVPGSPSADCTQPDASGNTIVLGAGSYALSIHAAGADDNTSGDLDVAASVGGLTLSGVGSATTTIDATGLGDRIISLASGASVTLSSVTLTGGHAPAGASGSSGGAGGAGANGGAISNAGQLILSAATVTASLAGDGGTGGQVSSGTAGIGGAGGSGGGVYNSGTLQVDNSTLSGNAAGLGGQGGAVTGASGTAGAGGPGGAGGGIYDSGTLLLGTSVASGNTGGDGGDGGNGVSDGAGGGAGAGGGGGGGIYIAAGALVAGSSTLDGDRAGNGGSGGSGRDAAGGNGGCGGNGGGVGSVTSGSVTVTASTISADVAGAGGNGGNGGSTTMGGTGGSGGTACGGAAGGGISLVGGSLTITNSTIAHNFAGAGGTGGGGGCGCTGGGGGIGGAGGSGGSGGSGGGVHALHPSSTTSQLVNATVFDNGVGAAGAGGLGGPGASTPGSNGAGGSAGSGGGVYEQTVVCVINNPCPNTTLQNTIVASDSGGNCSGQIADGAHDLSYPDSTCPGTNGDPVLGTLRDNGGPTQTVELGSGSAAVDQVPAGGAGCPMTDQRGLARPFGSACDIGAVEVTAPVATTSPPGAIGSTNATVAGAVTANTGDASVYFDVGTSPAYGMQSAVQHVGGLTAVGVSQGLAGLSPGTTYHYRVVAVAPAGTATGADETFTTTAAPGGTSGSSVTGTSGGTTVTTSSGGGASGAAGGGGSGGATAPILTGLRLSRSAFPAAGSGASIARKRITGTTVSYTDSQAATTTFGVFIARTGIKQGTRCVAPPRRKRGRRGRPCTRFTPVGSFTHSDLAGRNSFHFTGRAGGHKLNPGSYRLAATPRALRSIGRTVNSSFRIVR